MRFKIYYDSGLIYTGDPYLAPPTGVQVILEEDPQANRGFRVMYNRDMFYWKEGRWFSCDDAGMWDYLFTHIGPKAILFGRSMVRDEDFWAMVSKASAEGLD